MSRNKGKSKLSELFSSAETIIIRKDISQFWSNGSTRVLMIIVPLFLLVVIPTIYIAAICFMPAVRSGEAYQALRTFLPDHAASLDYRQMLFYAFTTYVSPMLFLTVPIMCSITSASSAFVSEKENGTLETLILTSIDAKTIFRSKVSGCFLTSLMISAVSFFVFFITATVGGVILSAAFFINLEWIIIAFILAPSVTFFGVVFSTLIMSKVRSTGEALQTMGYLLVPFILLFLLQFSAVIKINALSLLIISILIIIADVLIFNLSVRRFNAEKLFSKTMEE